MMTAGPAGQLLLDHTPEEEFFSEGGKDGNHQEVEKESPYSVDFKKSRGKLFRILLGSPHPLFQAPEEGG